MPSSGMPSIGVEAAEPIAKIAEEAMKHGLLVEWLAWFTGGVQAGVDPWAAACGAADEWDF